MNTPVPAPRWQRRKDARPTEITAAALALFVEKGFAATRLDEVATRAGVTKGTLYLYFRSKEDLFKAAVRETVLPTIILAEELVADSRSDAASLLRCLVSRWVELITDSPAYGISKLVIAEAANFPDITRFYLDEVVERVQNIFVGVIERGMQSGELRRMDASLAAREIISPIFLQMIWNQAFGRYVTETTSLRDYAQFHVDVLLGGMRNT